MLGFAGGSRLILGMALRQLAQGHRRLQEPWERGIPESDVGVSQN